MLCVMGPLDGQDVPMTPKQELYRVSDRPPLDDDPIIKVGALKALGTALGMFSDTQDGTVLPDDVVKVHTYTRRRITIGADYCFFLVPERIDTVTALQYVFAVYKKSTLDGRHNPAETADR